MKIALVGNQNSGKTTLFNYLTGMNAKVGNWPGVTIEKKSGFLRSDLCSFSDNHEIVDLPGIYSLSPYSIEEEISRVFIFDEKPDVIINIIDSACIERSLYLTSQLLELDCKVIVALNMVDLLEKKGFAVDEAKLEEILGAKVIKISALDGTGVDELLKEIEMPFEYNEYHKNRLYIYDANLEQSIQEIEKILCLESLEQDKCLINKRFVAVKLLENDERFRVFSSYKIRKITENVEKFYSTDLEEVIATERYRAIERIKKSVVLKVTEYVEYSMSDRLDKVFLNKWFAIPIFAFIMFLIYYLSVGIVGKVTVNFIGDNINKLKQVVEIFLKEIGISKWLISLIVDGIIAGVGSVLSFVPQLIILFTSISILETTGYMSRIALLLDKIFRKVGLSGKSLIPFIVGSGCSVPGIMGTRIIENSDEREMTAILTPFIPCSAKLPIIALFSGYFYKQNSALISVSLYFLSIVVIISGAIVMKKFIYKNTSTTYISELPEYKAPNVKYVARDVFDKINSFIKRAGSVILICSIVIWFLLSFSFKLEYGVDIEKSILASIGKTISWIFYPILGINSWGAAVSAIQGLVAKEQVISSMSVIAGLAEGAENQSQIFNSPIFNFFTPASAYAFMVFNLFSAPCFGTIAALKKELGSTEKTLKVITAQIIFAWLLAVTVKQLGINLIIVLPITYLILVNFKNTRKSKKECSRCPYCNDCGGEEKKSVQLKNREKYVKIQ